MTQTKKAKRYLQFLLIVLAAGAIYPLIYLRTNYQQTMLAIFDMQLSDLNMIYSVLGIVFVVGYFPSGLLSDRFSCKWLLVISLFFTSVGGFWFAQIPSYNNILIIYCIWGIFSVFTFWSAHMKLVKLLAKKEEEGRFFGILDGGRGVVEASLALVAIAIFSAFVGNQTDSLEAKRAGLVAVIYMYSGIMLLISILAAIFLDNDRKTAAVSDQNSAQKPQPFSLKDLGMVFKNKYVFLLGGIIFMGYSVYWTVYYLGGFLETNIGLNAVVVGIVTVIVLWTRPFGGVIGGFIADKAGKHIAFGGSMVAAMLLLVGISVLPITLPPAIFIVMIVLLGFFLYAIRGTYWSLLGDCKIDNRVVGVTVGIASFIGYMPDIFLPMINTSLFKTFGDNGGYNAYFIMSAVFALVGFGLVNVFNFLQKREKEGVTEQVITEVVEVV